MDPVGDGREFLAQDGLTVRVPDGEQMGAGSRGEEVGQPTRELAAGLPGDPGADDRGQQVGTGRELIPRDALARLRIAHAGRRESRLGGDLLRPGPGLDPVAQRRLVPQRYVTVGRTDRRRAVRREQDDRQTPAQQRLDRRRIAVAEHDVRIEPRDLQGNRRKLEDLAIVEERCPERKLDAVMGDRAGPGERRGHARVDDRRHRSRRPEGQGTAGEDGHVVAEIPFQGGGDLQHAIGRRMALVQQRRGEDRDLPGRVTARLDALHRLAMGLRDRGP